MTDDAILSRPGAINNDFAPESDASSLFLKVFSGEVIAAFDEYNVMKPLMMRREAPRGAKSAQFIVTGRAVARGLLPTDGGGPGPANITNLWQDAAFANAIRSNEKEVHLDGPIVAPLSITEFDELRAQYDVRGAWAVELGRGVAEEFDIRALLMVANGARAASLITATAPDNDRSGIRRVDADFNTNGASAAATIFNLKRLFDEKYVPALGRHLVITPECASNLAQQTDLINRDWVQQANGDFADGSVYKVAGFQLHVSARLKNSGAYSSGVNGLPTDGTNNRPGALNVYLGSAAPANTNGGSAAVAGNFSATVALAFHESGIGYLDRLGMVLESDYDVGYQSTLMVAKKLCGISWLRPEACAEITDA